MSYKCRLTSTNKLKCRSSILELYLSAQLTHSAYCYCFVLLLMFEYICAYYFIDSDADVTLKNLLSKKLVTKYDRRFLSILKDLRDDIAHNCVDTCDYLFIQRVLTLVSGIDNVSIFKVFEEESSNYRKIFIDSCHFLVKPESFDAVKFLKQYYGAKYDLLPIASVNDCNTLYDCLMLIKELENVL